MKPMIIIGALAALGTGITIGIQSAVSGRVGGMIGPIRTGLISNIFSGVCAGLIALVLVMIQGRAAWRVPGLVVVVLAISGSIGILVVTGSAFAVPRIGVTASMATIILGQLLISTLVDVNGWGGLKAIPLDGRRILGLLVMALAVYLLLPHSD